jgi:hypothetical protein
MSGISGSGNVNPIKKENGQSKDAPEQSSTSIDADVLAMLASSTITNANKVNIPAIATLKGKKLLLFLQYVESVVTTLTGAGVLSVIQVAPAVLFSDLQQTYSKNARACKNRLESLHAAVWTALVNSGGKPMEDCKSMVKLKQLRENGVTSGISSGISISSSPGNNDNSSGAGVKVLYNAHALWTTFMSRYVTPAVADKEQAKELVESIAYTDGMDPREYEGNVAAALATYFECGGSMSDSDLFDVLLDALPPSAATFKTSLLLTGTQSFSAAITALSNVYLKTERASDRKSRRGQVAATAKKSSTGTGNTGATSQAHAATAGKKPCKFFARTGKCKFGDECKFAHTSKGSSNSNKSGSSNTGTQSTTGNNNSTLTEGVKKHCKFWMQFGNCRNGSSCKWLHEANMQNCKGNGNSNGNGNGTGNGSGTNGGNGEFKMFNLFTYGISLNSMAPVDNSSGDSIATCNCSSSNGQVFARTIGTESGTIGDLKNISGKRKWGFDTCANVSICNNKARMIQDSIRRVDPIEIMVTNSTTSRVTLVGDVLLANGIKVRGCCYVPSSPINLISVAKARASGAITTFKKIGGKDCLELEVPGDGRYIRFFNHDGVYLWVDPNGTGADPAFVSTSSDHITVDRSRERMPRMSDRGNNNGTSSTSSSSSSSTSASTDARNALQQARDQRASTSSSSSSSAPVRRAHFTSVDDDDDAMNYPPLEAEALKELLPWLNATNRVHMAVAVSSGAQALHSAISGPMDDEMDGPIIDHRWQQVVPIATSKEAAVKGVIEESTEEEPANPDVITIDLVPGGNTGSNNGTLVVTPDNKDLVLWHRRIGHMSARFLKRVNNKCQLGLQDKQIDTIGMDTGSKGVTLVCPDCVAGKASRAAIHSTNPRPERKAKAVLDRIHCDLAGPISISSGSSGMSRTIKVRNYTIGGSLYAIQIRDEYSRYTVVETIGSKSDATTVIKKVIAMMEVQQEKRVKEFHCDGGKEFINSELQEWLDRRGTSLTYTPPYTPQHNALVESNWKVLFSMVRSMLSEAKAPPCMWGEALVYSNYIRNGFHCVGSSGTTPYEYWCRFADNHQHLRVWGCDAFVFLRKEQRGKVNSHVIKGVFVGWNDRQRTYRVLVPSINTIINSRNVNFDELHFTQMSTIRNNTRVTSVVDEEEHVELPAIPPPAAINSSTSSNDNGTSGTSSSGVIPSMVSVYEPTLLDAMSTVDDTFPELDLVDLTDGDSGIGSGTSTSDDTGLKGVVDLEEKYSEPASTPVENGTSSSNARRAKTTTTTTTSSSTFITSTKTTRKRCLVS